MRPPHSAPPPGTLASRHRRPEGEGTADANERTKERADDQRTSASGDQRTAERTDEERTNQRASLTGLNDRVRPPTRFDKQVDRSGAERGGWVPFRGGLRRRASVCARCSLRNAGAHLGARSGPKCERPDPAGRNPPSARSRAGPSPSRPGASCPGASCPGASCPGASCPGGASPLRAPAFMTSSREGSPERAPRLRQLRPAAALAKGRASSSDKPCRCA